jgi:holo-[acyl-carrier protein] synthase
VSGRNGVSEERPREHGVVASAFELVEIAEVERLLAGEGRSPFTAGELAYARARTDPARRLAARLAAKRAACRLLGSGVEEADVEVVRDRYGPPRLALSPRARQELSARGAAETLVSLTHERSHAAAVVLFLEEGP